MGLILLDLRFVLNLPSPAQISLLIFAKIMLRDCFVASRAVAPLLLAMTAMKTRVPSRAERGQGERSLVSIKLANLLYEPHYFTFYFNQKQAQNPLKTY